MELPAMLVRDPEFVGKIVVDLITILRQPLFAQDGSANIFKNQFVDEFLFSLYLALPLDELK